MVLLVLLNFLGVSPAALVLFGLEVFPLFQHLGVKLQLVIALGMSVARESDR